MKKISSAIKSNINVSPYDLKEINYNLFDTIEYIIKRYNDSLNFNEESKTIQYTQLEIEIMTITSIFTGSKVLTPYADKLIEVYDALQLYFVKSRYEKYPDIYSKEWYSHDALRFENRFHYRKIK